MFFKSSYVATLAHKCRCQTINVLCYLVLVLWNLLSTKVLVLSNSAGIAFPHLDINWTRYLEMCSPKYCEITKPMNPLQRVGLGFCISKPEVPSLQNSSICLWCKPLFYNPWRNSCFRKEWPKRSSFLQVMARVQNDMAEVYCTKSMPISETKFGIICILIIFVIQYYHG